LLLAQIQCNVLHVKVKKWVAYVLRMFDQLLVKQVQPASKIDTTQHRFEKCERTLIKNILIVESEFESAQRRERSQY